MPQIDVVLRFNSAADARNDPIIQQHMNVVRSLFQSDRVIAPLRAWRVSQDVAGTDADGNPTVTHSYLTGFYMLVSLPQIVPALRDHPAVQVAVDRNAANARQAGAVLKLNVSATVLQDIRFEPVFQGADYPFGAWT